jgi:hypothetical protein
MKEKAIIIVKDADGVQKESIQFSYPFKSDGANTLNDCFKNRANRCEVQKYLGYFGTANIECYLDGVLKATARMIVNAFGGKDNIIAKNVQS